MTTEQLKRRGGLARSVNGPTRYNLCNPQPPLTHTLHVEWCVVWDSGEREGREVEDYPWKEKASKQPAQQSPPFHITQQREFRAHSDNAPEHHRVQRSKLSSNMQMGRSLSLMFDYLMFIWLI